MVGGLNGVEPVKPRDGCNSTWEWLYHTYRAVERRWDRVYGEQEFSRPDGSKFREYSRLMDLLVKRDPESTIAELDQLSSHHDISDEDIDLAVELKKLIAEHSYMDDWRGNLLYESSDRSGPYDDAYHLALYLDTRLVDETNHLEFYRGQRKREWDLIPSLYRDPVDHLDPAKSRGTIDDRLETLAQFVVQIDNELNEDDRSFYDEDSLVAVAQHFHDAAKQTPRSWLLDVTVDPLIALYFAASSTDADAVGVVYQFQRKWLVNDLPIVGGQPGFRLIMPAAIPRIQRQEAAFLELHPVLLNQIIPRLFTFHQQEDLQFIDPYLGITEFRLLHAHSRLKIELESGRGWPMGIELSSDGWELESRAADPPTIESPKWLLTGNLDLHLEMVRDIVEETDTNWSSLSDAERDALKYIAYHHAYLQQYEFNRDYAPAYSINRFNGAISDFLDESSNPSLTLREFTEQVIKSEYSQHFDRITETLDQTMADMEDDWSPPMSFH